MKQLERLLFLQGSRCFFCGETIPTGEASIEHLVATSNGGAKDDENCVVCCKAVNTALGHLSVKAKLLAVLNHRGGFACPMPVESIASSTEKTNDDRVAIVVADLHKRGSSSSPSRHHVEEHHERSIPDVAIRGRIGGAPCTVAREWLRGCRGHKGLLCLASTKRLTLRSTRQARHAAYFLVVSTRGRRLA